MNSLKKGDAYLKVENVYMLIIIEILYWQEEEEKFIKEPFIDDEDYIGLNPDVRNYTVLWVYCKFIKEPFIDDEDYIGLNPDVRNYTVLWVYCKFIKEPFIDDEDYIGLNPDVSNFTLLFPNLGYYIS